MKSCINRLNAQVIRLETDFLMFLDFVIGRPLSEIGCFSECLIFANKKRQLR